jgi:hypothetical protein
MLRIKLSDDNDVELNIPENFTGVVHPYHERFLADDTLADVDVVLLSLHFVEFNNKKSGVTSDEVKRLFVALGRKEKPNFAVAFHRAKKQNFIEESDGIIRFQIKGIKHLEKLLGFVGKSPVYLIKAGQSFSAIKLFEEFLLNEVNGNEVMLCDSHISPSTLFPFSILKGKLQILKILTSNVYEVDKLNAYKEKLQKEVCPLVEIKKSLKIHDRYLISSEKCWGIGTSIKDLGNKDTVISDLSDVVNSLQTLFAERWDAANSI